MKVGRRYPSELFSPAILRYPGSLSDFFDTVGPSSNGSKDPTESIGPDLRRLLSSSKKVTSEPESEFLERDSTSDTDTKRIMGSMKRNRNIIALANFVLKKKIEMILCYLYDTSLY